MRLSSFVRDTTYKHSSRLVKAMQGFNEGMTSYSKPPDGVFGRVAIIQSGEVTINSDELDVEFTVPFSDMEVCEAEIIVYNLSKTTIQALKYNNRISITAGYKNDTGVIFEGKISKVKTKYEGIDKVTTIYALDDVDLNERKLVDVVYKKGTKASYILKDLISKLSIPLAVFKVRRDWTYKEEVNIDGSLMDNIKKYAEVCGISVYVNKGKLYARHISEGDNISFTVNKDTGLIGSPAEYSEEISAEDYNETINGYECEMILQHRMNTAAIINIESREVNGEYRVSSGEHTFNQNEAITKFKMFNIKDVVKGG